MGIARKTKLSIPFKWAAITAYAILIVPILIFFVGWLKWYFAILFSGVLLFGAYWAIKKDYWDNKDCIEMPVSILIGAGAAFTLWVLISGSCYVSVGSMDIIWRNTLLCDLVNYDWPTYYPESNEYLCYYFTFWLVPALFGKLFGGVPAAFIALACWMVFLLIVVFMLIAYCFKDYKKSTLKTIVVFMIMWSGINILGMLLVEHLGLEPLNLGWNLNENYCDYFWVDGDPFNFYYRSNQDFISECYNQLPMWIAVPLMMQNRHIRNYAFLGLLIFPFSPWGTVGMALIMIAHAIQILIKKGIEKNFIKEVFSVPNLCAIFSVFLVFGLFLGKQSGTTGPDSGFRLLPIHKMSVQMWQGALIFWLCEFGIYYLLAWKKYKKEYLFISMLPFLIIIPFFHIGPKYARDFGMNVSLPLLYTLMIYVIGYVKDEILSDNLPHHKKFRLRNCVLLVALGFSFTTPVFDWTNKISAMNTAHSISVQDRAVETFADTLGYEGVFISTYPDVDESTFFKYLGKPVNKENAKWLPISDSLSDIRTIDDINEYFDYLIGKNCTVFIAVQDIPGFWLTEETVNKMKQLGFSDEINTLLQKEYHSFIGIVDQGRIITEQIGGDEYITYYGEGKIDGHNVWMESGTWNYGNIAVINIYNGYYSAHGRGLNIVVWDHEAGRVIDSVAFDTHTEEMPCTRKEQ